jgi:hypothetical protein
VLESVSRNGGGLFVAIWDGVYNYSDADERGLMATNVQLTRAQFTCYALAAALAGAMVVIACISTPYPSVPGNGLKVIQIGLGLYLLWGALTTPYERTEFQTVSATQRYAPVFVLALGFVLAAIFAPKFFGDNPEKWRQHLVHVIGWLAPIAIGLLMMGSLTFAPQSSSNSQAMPAGTSPQP